MRRNRLFAEALGAYASTHNVKVRQTFPAGQTSASKIKALLVCFESKRGGPAVEAWLSSLHLKREDVEDETRLLPLGALHAALRAFVDAQGSLTEMGPHLVALDNLGTWVRLLRGTRAPEDAFARLDLSETEQGRTTRWETQEGRAGYWRGHVRIEHDPALEADGLLATVRALELAAVPMLFGFGKGTVKSLRVTESSQEFEVVWSVPNPSRGVAVGAGAGIAVAAAAFASAPISVAALVACAAPVILGAVGYAWTRDHVRRIALSAQAMRVHALERSLALREMSKRMGTGDLEGSVLAGQYRIGARMGAGASGVIYKATRLVDGLPVAIKLLRAATAHDAVASDRLRREAEALGLAWHPNVVEVIDHGHLPDGTSYLVMELLLGEPLATRLRRTGRMTPEQILPIAINLSEAVVAIHAAGVVHRDLKPANIYLTRDESGREGTKILDFGIARVEWEEMRITNMGAPLGTPGYMSPEQESGADVDARSDVYALGAVIYECLVGEPPPPSEEDRWTPGLRTPSHMGIRLDSDPEDTLRMVLGADSGVHPASRRMASAAPLPLPVDVPIEWRQLVERALAKRAEDRYQDARSLLAALRALRDQPAVARPPPGRRFDEGP